MRPLPVLMWKHLIVRKRRFIHTSIEVLLPLLYFGLMFFFRDLMTDPVPKSQSNSNLSAFRTNVQNTELYPLKFASPPNLILYYPETNVTHTLMDEVGRMLELTRARSIQELGSGNYYGSNSNTTQMPNIMGDLSDDQALVIFQNVDDGWPKRLNYTIRMKKDFLTHVIEALDDRIRPHERFGTVYQTFMRLQWAIDSSYLKLLSGKPINQTVLFQEFPFAETPTSTIAAVVCTILQTVCYVSVVLPFVFLMVRVVQERASGIQELIKMVGVSQWTLNASHFLNSLPTGLFYSIGGAILLTVSVTPLIPHTNPLLIFVALTLHYVTVVWLAFVCSYVVQSSQYATSLSVFAAVATWIPVRLLDGRDMPRALTLVAGLVPHGPIYWFWTEVGAVEQFGMGITFASMTVSHSAKSGSVLQCYVLMLVQTVALVALTWYLGLVRPGRHGVARPWNFLCQRVRSHPKVRNDEESEEEPFTKDPRYFEPTPPNADVGIQIQNVSKVFNKSRALSNVSFEVLKGEITVLLGHNGAGKTTLMSIITGMFSASEGRILVNGLDASLHPTAVRRQLGLCPQHNLFFPDLTVLEHVIFFSMLKGQPYREALASSRDLLKKLGIAAKADAQSNQLSGGMKRRLQLACALAGGADVLVLDEPTSGLDVETRRELWDLLLSLRGSRTVLLTTHFMEEADALGDRVAALHAGRLRCHATPMFLKKSIGTGYRLSMTTVGIPNEPAITHVVHAHVSDATLKEKSLNSLSYSLPAQSSQSFPALFGDLESKRPELGINSIGVGVSTLEEVFLRLCSNVETTFSQDTVDGLESEPIYKHATGLCLYLGQCGALMTRHLKYLWSKKLNFLIMQVLIPIALLFALTSTTNDAYQAEEKKPNSDLTLNLDAYEALPDRRVLYNVDDATALRSVRDQFPGVRFEETHDVASAVLLSGMKDALEYNKYLVGIEINDTTAKFLYTTTVRHAAPVALNLLSNALAARVLPWAGGRTITAHNHPAGGQIVSFMYPRSKDGKSSTMCGTWTAFVVFIILNTAMAVTSLLCSERQSGARHLHIMAGCPPLVHWGSTLMVYTGLYTLVLVVPAIIAASTMDYDHTISRPDFLGVLFVMLVLGVVSFLSSACLAAFGLRERSASVLILITVMVLGVFPALVYTAADLYDQDMGKWTFWLALLRYTVPANTVTSAVYRATSVARRDAYCDLNKDNCPNIESGIRGFDLDKCCVSKQPQSCYFCFNELSPGKDLAIMVAQIVVYMTLVTLAQYGVFERLIDRVFNMGYTAPAPRYNDEMVRAEKTYVSKANTLPVKQIPDAVLVDDVHKSYRRLLKDRIHAVKGISFSVKKGECFGVLGVNGAGKSTTFRMITAEESTTRGSITANHHRLQWPREKYMKSLGYCPQFFGLDTFLTGRENLALLLRLRGLSSRDTAAEVAAWIAVVGLERYGDVRVRQYSGGCTRRLAAAAALCAGAPTTLLDEPTAGVDVGARRRVWAAIRRALAARRSVIITSHSMDEMEALCSRIAIVARGEVAALGSPAALRAAHAAGHAVVIKLTAAAQATAGDVTDSAAGPPELQALKARLHEKFNCSIKDEHKTMLHYHINETLRYSELFEQLEQVKAAFPHLVEDYSVTETTLEEVFLSFAHDAEREGPRGAQPV